MRRLAKNRVTAKLSRQKKRDFVRDLSMKVEQLQLENSYMQQKIVQRDAQIALFKEGADVEAVLPITSANYATVQVVSAQAVPMLRIKINNGNDNIPAEDVEIFLTHPCQTELQGTPDFWDGLHVFDFLLEDPCLQPM
ncbi:hypothetical protein WJX77_001712 [Trebouxia sp. C0004]